MDLAMELTGDHSMSPAAVSAPASGGVPMVPSFYQGPVHQHHHGAEKAVKQLMTSGLGASGNGLKGGEQHKTSDQVVADQAREILRQAVVSGMSGGEKAVGGVLGKVAAAVAGENGKGKAVRYRECQKNHAAGIGGHALDGCGEFIPAAAVAEDPDGALRCAACDCHRNFHRREVEGEPCECKRIKAPTKTTFSPAAPALPLAMAAALSADSDDGDDNNAQQHPPQHVVSVKKRFRTKFSNDQKDQMCAFAEKLGWRIQKHDEAAVQEFCSTVGVKRHVLKVWMHNNKHTMGKKP